MNENIQLGNKKRKRKRIPTVTHLLTRMSTGHLWERYSTMMIQKNSRFQRSGNFSQPPSAIGDEDLKTQDLISEQNVGKKKSSFNIIKIT